MMYFTPKTIRSSATIKNRILKKQSGPEQGCIFLGEEASGVRVTLGGLSKIGTARDTSSDSCPLTILGFRELLAPCKRLIETWALHRGFVAMSVTLQLDVLTIVGTRDGIDLRPQGKPVFVAVVEIYADFHGLGFAGVCAGLACFADALNTRSARSFVAIKRSAGVDGFVSGCSGSLGAPVLVWWWRRSRTSRSSCCARNTSAVFKINSEVAGESFYFRRLRHGLGSFFEDRAKH